MAGKPAEQHTPACHAVLNSCLLLSRCCSPLVVNTGSPHSLGNVYVTSPTSSFKRDTCAYTPLVALERPPVANGKAQGFGFGLAATPDASTLVVGVAGCFVAPGGSPPPCPDFPNGSGGSGMTKPPVTGTGVFPGVQQPPTVWPGAQNNMTGKQTC